MFGKQHIRFGLVSTFAVLGLLFSSFGAARVSANQVTTSSTVGASSMTATPSCDPLVRFNRNKFSNPTRIDNQWFPLVPGTQFILDGFTNVGGVPTSHRVVFTVTDLTKVINGVRTRVMWDTDANAGELVESELAFQAQDKSGNVWVLGEYPEEYDAGVFTGAPFAWIAGLDSAKAGVLVPGHPQVGTPPFLQGFSPKIDFLDCGQVSATGQTISAPNNSYQNVLVIDEWAPREPNGGIQQKYYAPGVGNVQIGAVNDPQAETLVLTRVVHLGPRALAQARAEALKLDWHGYWVSKVYRKTPPAGR